MLSFERVSVRVGGKMLLSEVSLTIPKGKTTVILGRNGSGKTTLLHTVIGNRKYTGCIMLAGKVHTEYSERQRARLVGCLGQILPQSTLSVFELVSLGRNPYVGCAGKLSPQDRRIVENAMQTVCVTHLADRSVATLSGGEKQRVFLGMLLAQSTDLILLDEPTTYLDPKGKKELFSMLSLLAKEQGKTVVLVLHDPSDAIAIADHIVILEAGRAVYEGSKEDCLKDEAIEGHFGLSRVCHRDMAGEHVFFY